MADTPAAGDAVLLQLMWLASPALPVGGFSYSEALEAAVDDGRVTGEASAADWLANQMALAPARADLPVLAQAHAAWQRHDLARVTQLNDFIGRTRETPRAAPAERADGPLAGRVAAQPAGRRRRRAWRHLAALAPSPTWPIAFALATARANASAAQALHASLFGWAENMVQAALKAVPLGQLAGQRILQALVDADARADRAGPGDGRRRHAVLLADAGHRQRPPRDPVFAPVPFVRLKRDPP